MHFDLCDRLLMDGFQHGFPLVAEPFAEVARLVDSTAAEVLARYQALREAGVVARIGPLFHPHRVGASTLAALAVPPERLDAVAALVSAYPEVNHNYARAHHFNLWFVVVAPTAARVREVLAEIAARSDAPLLDLPMERGYHLDLGFSLWPESAALHAQRRGAVLADDLADLAESGVEPEPVPEPAGDPETLIGALREGIPLVPRPYAAVGGRVGLSESAVRRALAGWWTGGLLSRFGVVVRHGRLGFRANAMVVWDVPDVEVDAVGAQLRGHPGVGLCYRRPRRQPDWPYNLFTMIHGHDPQAVQAIVADIAELEPLQGVPHVLLFTTRGYKQTAPLYGIRFPGSA